jgi:Mg/Co/Ni transporter MgtE
VNHSLSLALLLFFIAFIFTVVAKTTDQAYSITPSGNSTNITSNESAANMTKAEPSDLIGSDDSLLVTDVVAQELSSGTPSEIAVYPLSDFSTDDIMLILNMLSTGDLEKVLTNIPLNELKRIFNEVPEDQLTELLNDIPQDSQQKIKQRMQS